MFSIFRHALEDSVERTVAPALAAVIQFVDVHRSLDLLYHDFDGTISDGDDITIKGLWLEMFRVCHLCGLEFHKIREGARRDESKSVSTTIVKTDDPVIQDIPVRPDNNKSST